MDSLAQKSGWSAVASFSAALGRLISGIIIARNIGPEGMGQIAYLMWVAEISGILSNLGLPNSLTRFLAEVKGSGHHEQIDQIINWIFLRYLVMAIFGTCVLILIGLYSDKSRDDQLLWFLICAFFFLQGAGTFYQANLTGKQRFDLHAKLNFISSVLLVAGIGIGSRLYGVKGAVTGYMTGIIIPAMFCVSLIKRHNALKPLSPELSRRIWKYALNTWLAAIISAFVWSRLEIVFLEHYWNRSEIAMFTVGMTLAALAAQVPTMLGGALLPHFAEKFGANDMDAVKRVYASGTRLMSFMLFPLCMGISAIIPVLLPLMYGERFIPAIPNAMVLVAFASLSFANVGSALVYGLNRPRFIALGGLLGAVMALLANCMIIPKWGAWGAVWARSFVQTSMIGLGTWYIAFHLHCPVPLRTLGKTLVAAILCGCAAYFPLFFCPLPAMLIVSIFLSVLTYIMAVRKMNVFIREDAIYLQHIFARLPHPVKKSGDIFLKWILPGDKI